MTDLKETRNTAKVHARDLDWTEVRNAAVQLQAIANSAHYAAPEITGIHLKRAEEQMNLIAEALCFTRM